jgi:hypothetical protein
MTLEQLQARVDSLEAANREKSTKIDSLTADVGRLTGANTALTNSVAEKNTQLANAIKGDASRVDGLARERVSVLKVAEVIAPTLKCDSLSTDAIRLAVVQAARPELAADDKTDSRFLAGVFAGIKVEDKSNENLAKLTGRGPSAHTDADDGKPSPVSLTEIKRKADAASKAAYEPLARVGNVIRRVK